MNTIAGQKHEQELLFYCAKQGAKNLPSFSARTYVHITCNIMGQWHIPKSFRSIAIDINPIAHFCFHTIVKFKELMVDVIVGYLSIKTFCMKNDYKPFTQK